VAFAETGELRFDDADERVGPAMSAAVFAGSRLRGQGVLHLGPAERFTCRTYVEGRPAHVTIWFAQGQVASVELVLLDGAGAKPFSDEPRLKREHEAWLLSLTGLEPELVPLLLDGRPLLPATPGPDHPRRVARAWGEAVSLLDAKSGGASIAVRYARRASATPV